jgi:uncharacterized protein (TIGR03000 family)
MCWQPFSGGSASPLWTFAVAATTFLLAAAGGARAQSGHAYYDSSDYNGYWYHYKTYQGYDPGYYGRPDRVLPHGVSPGHYGAYPSATRPPFTPGQSPRTETAITAMRVQIDVRVPADAEIWFGDVKTTQTGTFRRFVSPPVTPRYEYTYEVRARWHQDGREVFHSHRITFHAGENVNIAFPEAVLPKAK